MPTKSCFWADVRIGPCAKRIEESRGATSTSLRIHRHKTIRWSEMRYLSELEPHRLGRLDAQGLSWAKIAAQPNLGAGERTACRLAHDPPKTLAHTLASPCAKAPD